MVDEPDRKKLSFAEAEGLAQFPSILRWGEIDQRLRAAIWNKFWVFFDVWIQEYSHSSATYYREPLNSILLREHVKRRHGFGSEFKDTFVGKKNAVGHWAEFFRNADYVDLFDFVTFFLRDRECPSDLIDEIEEALDVPWSPYRLVKSPPTIFPAASDQEATILKRDLKSVLSSSFDGARTHIQTALDALNKGDNRAVVRESIHAVESAIRGYTGDQGAVLSQALRKLVKEAGVHAAMATAFEKLYAYTSDESGIRHALVIEDNDKVRFDEAMFFLSACSAFIAFLARKKHP